MAGVSLFSAAVRMIVASDRIVDGRVVAKTRRLGIDELVEANCLVISLGEFESTINDEYYSWKKG